MRDSPSPTGRERLEVSGAHGGSFERDDAAPLEDVAENGFGEVGIAPDAAPPLKRLVGSEVHRATAVVVLGDAMEENVADVGAVGEVSDFVTKSCGRT